MAEGGDNISSVSSKRKIVGLEDFEILSALGEGAFGRVFKVRERETEKLYALKAISNQKVLENHKGVDYVHREREVLQAIRNRNFLLNLHFAFQTKNNFVFITDYYAGRTVHHLLERVGPLKEDEAKFYLAEVVVALETLHTMRILYRDLKPENILIDFEGHVSLADFGLSKLFGPREFHRTLSFSGSPEYLAPEIFKKRPYSYGVDWWTLGILTYILLTDIFPFKGSTIREIERTVIHGHYHLVRGASPACTDFIRKLLIKDPQMRLGSSKNDAQEVKQHYFFQNINWNDVAQKRLIPPYVINRQEESTYPEDLEIEDSDQYMLPKRIADQFQNFYFSANEEANTSECSG